MNGDVAVDGPARGSSRPPLPPKPRAPNRSRKQRERETPDVDWERSLQHFAAAVSDDLDELHMRFLQENDISFTAWKRLWTDTRMSAAFHVEFWESSPTNTHKTILQQTLDALVGCIEECNGEFESAADVASLIGRVFALYCAYSVQLGDPKHKVDVDPQAWTALLTINCVMCGVGGTLHATAAREVRAMMHRLVVEENAFLRCLQGFGPSVRVRKRTVRVPAAGGADAGQDSSLVEDNATEEDAPVKQSTVEQLKSLNDHYQELMSRTRSAGPSVAGAGARLGGRRGKPAVSASLLSTREAGNDGQELARALASYVEYKAHEESRANDRVARAAAAREYESRHVPEQTNSERDDRSNVLDLSERGSVMSVPPSPIARSIASIQRGPNTRRDSVSSEAFLAELESELHADISSDQVESATTSAPRNKRSSAVNGISEADSDALADLERELEQSVGMTSYLTKEKTAPAQVSPPARRKRGIPATREAHEAKSTSPIEHRGKQASAVSEVSEADSDGLADLERELEQSIEMTLSRPKDKAVPAQVSPPARRKRGRPRKTDQVELAATHAPRRPMTKHRDKQSSAISEVSEADSDALADLERELEQSVELTSPRTKETAVPAQVPPPARRKRGRPRKTDQVELAATHAPRRPMTKHRDKQSSAISEVSEAESDALADLERELEQSVGFVSSQTRKAAPEKTTPPTLRKRGRPPSATGIVPRKSFRTATSTQKSAHAVTVESICPTTRRTRSDSVASRLSFADSWAVASTADSDGLAEIQAELNAIPTLAGPLETAPESSPRDSNTQQRPPESKNGAVQLLSAKLKPKPKAKQSARQPAVRAGQRRKPSVADVEHVEQDRQKQQAQSTDQRPERRARALSTVSDSSELIAQLQDELNFSAGPLGKTMARVTTTSTSAYQTRLRRSSRLSSVASEAESNALEELEKELNATAATLGAVPPVTALPKTTTSRNRGAAGSKRPAQVTTRNTAKKKRSNDEGASAATTMYQPTTTQAASKATTKQRASKSGPVATQETSRISSVSSDTESDGLAELVAELGTTVTAQSSTVVQQKQKSPAKKSNTRKTPSAPTAASLRRSARLSSLASDTESDGLEDLMSELESTIAAAPASKSSVANTKKPTARAVTTRKQPTRAQAAKPKQSQTKERPKTSRTPQAPRQTQQKCVAVKKVTAKPPTRQTPADPVNLPSSRRSTRSSSVAFDSDSDGLAELEAELQAGPT